MASKKFHLESIAQPVMTDMHWAIGTGINNQTQYKREFAPLFANYSTRGVIDNVGNTAFQVGVVSSAHKQKQSNSVSLAHVLKQTLKGYPKLKKLGYTNLYLFWLKDKTYYVLGLFNDGIKIDFTITLDSEQYENDVVVLIQKISDIEFALQTKVAMHICCSDHINDITAQGESPDILSLVDRLSFSSNEAWEVQNSDQTLKTITQNVTKKNLIFLKNVESKGNSATNVKLLALGFVVAIGGYWYYNAVQQAEWEAEQHRMAKNAAAQERAAKLEEAERKRLARQKKFDTPDLKSKYEQLKASRQENEAAWVKNLATKTGMSRFEKAQALIQNAKTEAQSWVSPEIKVTFDEDISTNATTQTFVQKFIRNERDATILDLAQDYPDINVSLDGDSAFIKRVEVQEIPKRITHSFELSGLIVTIAELQSLEAAGIVESWSLRNDNVIAPTPLSKDFIELNQKFGGREEGTPPLSEGAWLNELKSRRLIVRGGQSNFITLLPKHIKDINNMTLIRVIYDIASQTTVIEARIHEIK